MDCKSNTLSLIIQLFVAIGTIAISILAIWGDWFRIKLASPKLVIEPHNLQGSVTNFNNGQKVIYYHLKVVNKRTWAIAKNCKVLLRALYKKSTSNKFQEVKIFVPPQFVWAPAEITQPSVEISTEQILDFGRLIEKDDSFRPVLYSYPNNFQGYVKANETLRYALEIKADGFRAKHLQVFEVTWDGIWAGDLVKMGNHLIIKEIDKIKI